MFKNDTISAPAYESTFIRQALLNDGLRLDGRALQEFRAINMQLSRSETSSICEVQWGENLVCASATGEITAPFPDRPLEGFLLFSTDMAETAELSHSEVTRYLEKTIRNSDALDLESLCIIGGEKVWQVKVSVHVLDGSGGNLLDACTLACMGAMKAFRRPDISVVHVPVGAELTSKLVIHHSDDREPLPLALQHTPLCATLGIFKRVQVVTKLNNPSTDKPAAASQEKLVYLIDPSAAEEACMDGKITFAINAYKELCSILKPGGVSLPSSAILAASALCTRHIHSLHALLATALQTLENQTLENQVGMRRMERLEILQRHTQLTRALQGEGGDEMDLAQEAGEGFKVMGVDRNDPILQFNNLHQAATSK
eukprot:gene31560-38145_t